jgi:hypothetical protein
MNSYVLTAHIRRFVFRMANFSSVTDAAADAPKRASRLSLWTNSNDNGKPEASGGVFI